MTAPRPWSASSWRDRQVLQQPEYPTGVDIEGVLDDLRRRPPLVHPGEIDSLKEQLARAAAGERFVLQGGDCAERFQDCDARAIEDKLKILLQMSLVLTWGARTPVVRVARMAGQYAKPRSKPTETVGGREIPTYRGDIVSGHDPADRTPDPGRMLEAYGRSAATLNYARALGEGGFADLHHPHHWDLAFVKSTAHRRDYEDMVERILDALDFVETTGVRAGHALRTVDLFTSHEGLLLAYEEAMTRPVGDRSYNVGTHFLWIGDRTRQLEGAHVEYFRGLANPIGLKISPTLDPDELVALVRRLDPGGEPGRITLITRYGADRIAECLPRHRAAIDRARLGVLWSCDPMHGNTVSTESGVKTRQFGRILDELRSAFTIHEEAGGRLGGVHFELTGDDVTECVGGPQDLSEADLARRYQTFCDPRLNYAQSLELAFLVARHLQASRQRC